MARGTSPSIAQVADLSGVAKSTVSRILNKHQANFSVKDETRQRVLEVAERLNYRPNPIVRSLAAKRTNLIAVVGLSDFGTAIRGGTEEAANALMHRLYRDGYELCVNVLSPREPAFAPPRWRVDGAIVVDSSDPQQLQGLDDSGLKYVALNGPAGPRGSSVTVDDDAGTRTAIHHLCALGHRRIAYAAPDEFNWHQSLVSRRDAYVRALEEVGLAPIPGFDALGTSPFDVVRRAVVEGGATAILAYHHLMAVKLLRAAATLNLQVPRHVSIVCFNDLAPCADLVPSLTAMSLPSQTMGTLAAELLLEQLRADGPALPRHVKLPQTLVIRESTAPPPSHLN